PFVMVDRAGAVAYGARALGNPDYPAVPPPHLVFQRSNESGGFYILLEPLAHRRVHVNLVFDVGNLVHQVLCALVSVHPGESRVDSQVTAVGRALIDAFHRVFEHSAVAGLGGPQRFNQSGAHVRPPKSRLLAKLLMMKSNWPYGAPKRLLVPANQP